MDFIVADECLRLGLRAGAVSFRGLKVVPTDPVLRAEIGREVKALRARFATPAAVRAAPEIAAFQDLLRQVGVNPRKEQPSVERLVKLALKRNDLPAVNSLVDAYNLVSVRSFCSLGAHDLDRLMLPVALRLLAGRELFTPLGRDAAVAVTSGEYGYVDARDRVLCRLDLLQAEFSKVTAATTNVFLIVEGTASHPPAVLRQAFDDVIAMVTRFCGGTAKVIAFAPTSL
jgi:DNA/RNA-binding domain of Phe-tRNA-synthetase-like protein